MPVYTFNAEVSRMVDELVEIKVIADDIEEAQDIVHTVIHEYPHSDLDVSMYLCRNRFYHEPESINLAFVDIEKPEEDDG